MNPVCLIASADAGHVAALQRGLKEHGVKLHGVAELASLQPMLAQWRFDAVLCDADAGVAADLDAVLRSLHRDEPLPIVVLAAQVSEDALVSALQAGATERIARDTSARLIAARLKRLIELAAGAEAAAPRAVSLGALHLDPRHAEAAFGNRALRLTRAEFELLLLLATRSERFVHRDTIMRTIGRAVAATGESRRCADMHVCRIRKKLRDAGASSLALETVYGRGYALRLRGEVPLPRPAS